MSTEQLTAADKTRVGQEQGAAGHLCWRCYGTGHYHGPRRRLLNGKPYCMACSGDGLSPAGRAAGVASVLRLP